MYFKTHTVRLMLWVLAFSLLLARGAEAQSSTIGAKIVCLVRGQLRIRVLPQGEWRVVTPQERRSWLDADPRGSIILSGVRINTGSWNGKYAADTLDNVDGRRTIADFGIVDPAPEFPTSVMGPETIDRLVIVPGTFHHFLYFGGWLPDSRHFVVMEHSKSSSSEFQTRCVIDIRSRRRIIFNGWLATDGKVALVPNVEGEAYEDHSIREGGNGTDPKYVPFKSRFRFFVIRMPNGGLASYRLQKSQREELHLGTKPFQLDLCQPEVEFSKDDKWAICRSVDTSDYSEYLVSTVTGVVKKIIGEKAHFL